MVCPLTHTQLGNHSQASHVMILEIFERLPPPKKRTLKFQALVLVNPFSKHFTVSKSTTHLERFRVNLPESCAVAPVVRNIVSEGVRVRSIPETLNTAWNNWQETVWSSSIK